MKKYELTEETMEVCGHILHRINAVRDFDNVKAGDIGGWIEKEENLSQMGGCWVDENACVYGDAKINGDAWVSGDARVSGSAWVRGNAWVGDNARVSGDAWVRGNAWVGGNALVGGDHDYMVFKNWWSSGRYFTWTRSNDMWRVGCFYGTGEELIAKAYRDSEKSGREYERIVKYVEEIKNERI